eukprot:1973453-Amphidinium_carterae.1
MAEHRVALLSEATSKKPPGWSAEQKKYPFTDYMILMMKDVALWTQITELCLAQQAPALALQLRGEAREVVHDLDACELFNGRVGPATGNALIGMEVLLHEPQCYPTPGLDQIPTNGTVQSHSVGGKFHHFQTEIWYLGRVPYER